MSSIFILEVFLVYFPIFLGFRFLFFFFQLGFFLVCKVQLVKLCYTHMSNVCPSSHVRTEPDLWSNPGFCVNENRRNVFLQIAELPNVFELPNAFGVRNVRQTFGKAFGRSEPIYDLRSVPNIHVEDYVA